MKVDYASLALAFAENGATGVTLKFEDINSDEVHFYRQNYTAWGYTDLRVDVGGGQGVVIPYQLYNPSKPYIENFAFANGVTLTASQVRAMTLLG
jgi:hypothetical protein